MNMIEAQTKYKKNLADLEEFADTVIKISIDNSGLRVDTWQEEYGSYYFAKIAVTAASIIRLLPKSSTYSTDSIEVWDLSSLCVLTRALAESYYKYFYFTADDISDDEREARILIYKASDILERVLMLKKLGLGGSKMPILESDYESKKKQIDNNPFIRSLGIKQKVLKKKIEDGALMTTAQIAIKSGIAEQYHRSVYKYLSNYTHSSPMSVSQLASFSADDPDSIRAFSLPLDYCSGYLSFVLRDAGVVFGDVKKYIDPSLARKQHLWLHVFGHMGEDVDGT